MSAPGSNLRLGFRLILASWDQVPDSEKAPEFRPWALWHVSGSKLSEPFSIVSGRASLPNATSSTLIMGLSLRTVGTLRALRVRESHMHFPGLLHAMHVPVADLSSETVNPMP